VLPRIRESARCVAVIQLNEGGLIVPMHITRITSPLVPSSLLEAIMRGLSADACSDVGVYWRLLVAFLAQPEGDAQELLERDGAGHRRVEAAAHAEGEDRVGVARKEPAPLPSERRRLQKEKRAAERRAREDARAAAAASAVAEANAVLETQMARSDATSAWLTRVLAKRGSTASADVLARARDRRDALKATERAARRPAKEGTPPPERASAARARCEGAEVVARSAAAALVLQRYTRAWLRGRRKARRKERSRAAKCIQHRARAWLRPPPKATSLEAPAMAVVPPNPAAPPPQAAPPPLPPSAAEEGDDDASCVVCLARPRAVVLLPCRHLSMCALCAADVPTCPLCRGAVEETMVVFV